MPLFEEQDQDNMEALNMPTQSLCWCDFFGGSAARLPLACDSCAFEDLGLDLAPPSSTFVDHPWGLRTHFSRHSHALLLHHPPLPHPLVSGTGEPPTYACETFYEMFTR